MGKREKQNDDDEVINDEKSIVINEKIDFPIAEKIENDDNVQIKIVGKLDDLEVSEFVFRPLFVYRNRQRPPRRFF